MAVSNDIIQITENISYLPATTKPFSCDIGIIKTEKCTWIYDVGLGSGAAEVINQISGPKNVVLSHFHPDHIMNLCKIDYENLYVSEYTKKYTKKGTVVHQSIKFEDNPEVTILELPSSHAKGCLALVCQDYAFLGDGTFCKIKIGAHSYNVQKLGEMIEVLELIPANNFCLSHEKKFIQNKKDVVDLYKKIYSRRDPKKTSIDVEDFFNSDGSVKVN